MEPLKPTVRIAGRRAIVWGGLACGVLDIAAALGLTISRGGHPLGLLQSIASAVLGRAAFQGGWAAAGLGFAMHFGVAFTVATVFWVASRRIPVLVRHAVPAGLVYGAGVYVVMSWGVIPLCALVRQLYLTGVVVRFLPLTFEGLAIHLCCVGLPVALAARWAALAPRPESETGLRAGAR